MHLSMLWAILIEQERARRRVRWSRVRLQQHQDEALGKLRAHAYQHSSFYQHHHRGLFDRPLSELPITTKADLMEHFDQLVTDPRVHLRDVMAHLEHLRGDDTLLDRYRVCSTSGTTGQRGLFLSDRSEWATAIASYERAMQWAGVRSGLLHRPRISIVSSRVAWHASARVGATLENRIVPVLRLDATDPIDQLVARLNEFAPEVLVGYASMLRVLAGAKLDGRLRIVPSAVISASEVLTPDMRQLVNRAFNAPVFNVYAATETANIASECSLHTGMHLYEDFVITEVVDEENRPVPVGTFGAKVLVTVLFSRTQPLIRYAMSDRIRLTDALCLCGSAFRMIDAVEGRTEEVLMLPGTAGTDVAIHPNVFHAVLESLASRGWQVLQETDRLRVLVVDEAKQIDGTHVASMLLDALRANHADSVPIDVERVSAIPRTATGKAPLIRRQAGVATTHGR